MNMRACVSVPVEGTRGMPPAPPAEALKQAFALFPSGVVIAATVDRQGMSHCFTASAFAPLSIDPPMLLVCLNVAAQCYPAFASADRFAVSVLRAEHRDHALRFATRGVDKFAGAPFHEGPRGMPILDGALAAFECRVAARYPGGDHIILTGHVEHAHHPAGPAMVHFMRSFQTQDIALKT